MTNSATLCCFIIPPFASIALRQGLNSVQHRHFLRLSPIHYPSPRLGSSSLSTKKIDRLVRGFCGYNPWSSSGSMNPRPPSPGTDTTNNHEDAWDIEEIHTRAVMADQETYIDPITGLTVFTALAHQRRGRCCGSRCRHCPYNDWNHHQRQRRSNRTATHSSMSSSDTESDRDSDSAFFSAESCNYEVIHRGGVRAHPPPQKLEQTGIQNNNNDIPEKKKKKNVPYTRTGDEGTSQLMNGERRSKHSIVFEVMGTVDELCSVIGLAHALIREDDDDNDNKSQSESQSQSKSESNRDRVHVLDDYLVQVMSRLFDIGSHIANPKKMEADDDEVDNGVFAAVHVQELEHWIDSMTEDLPELRNFILPTGTVAAAQMHVARTVCRRTERSIVQLVQEGYQVDPNALRYLNRLSDFLFTAARWINAVQGTGEEIQYKKPSKTSGQREATVYKNRISIH